MSRFLAGFATGVGVVWAALAIWQRLPAVPDGDVWDGDVRIDEDMYERPGRAVSTAVHERL